MNVLGYSIARNSEKYFNNIRSGIGFNFGDGR